VDEDNSGSIDFDEFLTMMKKKMMENDRRSEDVRAAFDVFDQVGRKAGSR
jgi:Ca2+-binding EF-hand superfamily protein